MNKVKLGEIAESQTGPFGSQLHEEDYVQKGTPIVTVEHLGELGFTRQNLPFVSDADVRRLNKYVLREGDIVFSRVGSIDRNTYVTKAEDGWMFSGRCIRVRCNPQKVNPLYLSYYFRQAFFKKMMLNVSVGATMPSLNTEIMDALPISLLERADQNKIADCLYSIDEKIRNNNAICSDLESMAKLLYDYWFVQFDFPDENGKPYKSSGGKMTWNEELKREIPEGWEVQKIGDIIYTERGISYSTPNIATGEGVPMLNLATFMPGGGDYKADGLKHFLGDYPKSKTLKPYDLIMCNTQQTAIKFETDIIGRAMLTPDVFDGDVVFSHHVNVIRTDDESLKYYLLFLFNSNYFHKYISGFTNGTNILGLSFNGVEDYLLEIPSHDLLTKFGAVVLETEKKKSAIFKENQQLGELRDFLLPMLMNGQVKVGGVVE